MPDAIQLIRSAINDGAKWFVRSDLKSFFQTIPKPQVRAFLEENVAEKDFVDLFMNALNTELENESEVRELIHLFPLGDIGVPQGSALSAICANIVLSEFDSELNGRGICTIRYLDDFLILGRSRRAVEKAWARAKAILTNLGMECHDPKVGGGKAAMGEIVDGFQFLSFHIDANDVFPSAKARSELLKDIRNTISKAMREINKVGSEPRRAEPRFIQSLALIDNKIRGWTDAFSATTKKVTLAQIDQRIDQIIERYLRWFGRVRRPADANRQRRMMGVALLIDVKTRTADISTSPDLT